MSATQVPEPATWAPRISMETLAAELPLLAPSSYDRPAVPADLDQDFLRDDDRAPWCRLARVLYDSVHFSKLAEGEHALRRWLRPAYTAGWAQRVEAPDVAAMILRNSTTLYLMWPWTDFNSTARYVVAMKIRHLHRLTTLQETVSAALGPPRSRPRVDALFTRATASERFRFSPQWQKDATPSAHAAQIVFEAFWLGLVQGCLRGPSPLLGAVLIEYLR
jgi:hypothetical protein